jgi:hypothetical protein
MGLPATLSVPTTEAHAEQPEPVGDPDLRLLVDGQACTFST